MVNALIETIDVLQGFTAKYLGVSYVCPHCHVILSVSLDPIALKTDIIKGVKRALGKG